MNAAIEQRLETAGGDYWIEQLNSTGVPCDRLMTLPEVFVEPQAQDQEMMTNAAHPGRGEVKRLGFLIKFSEASCLFAAPPLM